MNVQGNSTRLATLTKELLANWAQVKEHWRDSKSAEFETRYLQELLIKTSAAIAATDKLGTVLNKIRRDCE